MNLLDSASEMPYKLYITVGFITGTISSVLAGHAADVILTFLLGIASALGAALGKYILTSAKKQIKHYTGTRSSEGEKGGSTE